jgi:hypothetical protein
MNLEASKFTEKALTYARCKRYKRVVEYEEAAERMEGMKPLLTK